MIAMGYLRTRAANWARVFALIPALCTGPAIAQDWITPEACEVTKAVPDPTLLDAADQEEIRANAAAISNGVGRLWQVTSPQGQVSHLWGTFHSSDRLILDLPPELTALLAEARVLVLEYDPVAASRTVLEERLLQAGTWMAPSDPPYEKTFLDGRVLDWATARVTSVAGDDRALAALTDAGLAMLLLSDPCEDFAAGVFPIQDFRLYLAAYEAGLPVAGLESWDAFLSEMSQSDRQQAARAIAEIYGSYLNPQRFSAGRAGSMALYLQGRTADLMAWNQLYLDHFFGREKAAKLAALANGYLLEDRTRIFLRGLRKPLDQGAALIAVGAFHLPGKTGLISLLRAGGYRVERVATAGEAR